MLVKPFNNNHTWRAVLNWKTIIFIILIGIALYVLLPRIIGAAESVQLLLQTDKFYLVLALVTEAGSYLAAGWLMLTILKMLRYHLKLFDLIRIGVLNAFAIHALPVGGLGEVTVNFYFLRRLGVTSGSTLLMFVLKSIFIWISFSLFCLIGLILAPAHGHLSFNQQIVILSLLLFAFLFLWYLIYLYRHKHKMYARAQSLGRLVNWFALKIFKKHPISQEKINEVVDDIYQGLTLFSKDRKAILPAVLGGLGYWAGDIFCLGIVFLAFGYGIPLGVLFLGYTLATLLSMVSLIPGGIGIIEGSMGLLFISFGVSSGVAWMSVLSFRLLSFWIPFLVGIWSFASLQKETNTRNTK